MLSSYSAVPTIPTSDLAAARAFYEGTLGFAADEEVPEGIVYGAGANKFLLYQSAYAGTNKATYMSFEVPDPESFDAEVAALRGKGVSFDVFDVEDGEWDDGVLSAEGMKGVWFSDPDGNILNVETR